MSEATAGQPCQPGSPPGSPTGWLSRRALLILLVASVALNLCFVAGALWTRWHAPARWAGVEQRYQQMAADLGLNPQQKIAFDAYVATMRTRTEKMRQQVGPVMDAAWEEIAKSHADAAQVALLLDYAAEKRREFQHEASAQTLDFLATLAPAQRSKFVAIARERRAAWLRARSVTH